MRQWFTGLAHHLGNPPQAAEGVVCLLGGAEELPAAYPKVDAALRQRRGYRLIIVTPPRGIAETQRRYPYETVLPMPDPDRYDPWSRGLKPALVLLSPEFSAYAAFSAATMLYDDTLTAQAIVHRLPQVEQLAPAAGGKSILALLVGFMAGRPIDKLEDFARALDHPQHILCLGNGPSSEDPRLANMSHDCLFRVNWIWRERGLFTSPNLVITADTDLPCERPGPLLAFPNRITGLPLVWRHCLRLHPPRRGYLYADALIDTVNETGSNCRPSNGAVMIALAATLNPQRIVIAGMDLYKHAEGRYPGDPLAVDGYSRDHDREWDVEFICRSLARYEGETIIISDGLREVIQAKGHDVTLLRRLQRT